MVMDVYGEEVESLAFSFPYPHTIGLHLSDCLEVYSSLGSSSGSGGFFIPTSGAG
jgi:hypothetical protein